MDRYRVDLDGVVNSLDAPRIYKLASVQSRIERLGCGVVRFVDDNNRVGLWKIMSDDNGEEYIAAMYDEDTESVIKNSWSVETDKLVKTATIYYKSTPVTNLVFAELGVPASEVESFVRNLPDRLQENKEVVNAMLKSVDENYRSLLLKQFPEIIK